MKAVTLTNYLDGAGIRARRASLMDTAQWQMLAAAAAVPEPSAETRALVISMLRTREEVRKQLACLRRRQRTHSTEAGRAESTTASLHVVRAGWEEQRP